MNYVVTLVALLCAGGASPGIAASPVCDGCGCCAHVRKVCRIVCEWEEVKKVTYGCEREDFCIPGRSKKCGCREICTCGQVRTRRKLVKHEEVKRVPKYKCVVEYLCPHCCEPCRVKKNDLAGSASSRILAPFAGKTAAPAATE